MNLSMLPLALQGFREAQGRHSGLRTSADPTSLFVSAAECVYWAATIDEQMRSWPNYADFTEQNPVGQILPGVRYVRNLKTHSLPMTMRRISGAIYPIVFPMVFAEVVWLPLDQLPPPNRITRYTPSQADSYAQQMAGSPTRHTLQRLADGFAELEAFDDSPLQQQRKDHSIDATD